MAKTKGRRPDGLIQVSVTIDGKRRYFYGHTRAEAKEKAATAKYRPATKTAEAPGISVRDWVEQYLTTYRTGVNQAYIKNDNVPYNRLADALGTRELRSITEADLQAALNQTAGMSFSTCRNYHQVIRRVFRKAYRNRLIPDDPSVDLRLPTYTKGTHRALEAWEVSMVVENWDAPDQWAGLWIMIMLLCGLRRGEMMALDWKDVDLDSGVLSVTQVAVIHGNQIIIEPRAKTEAGLRSIPICSVLRSALETTPLRNRNGLVCRSARGCQLSETAVSRGLEKSLAVWSKLAGRQLSFRYHDLRHTYATMLYESGVDVKVAQYFMGHADLKITLQLYTHLSQRHRENSTERIIAYLDGIKKEGPEPEPPTTTLLPRGE